MRELLNSGTTARFPKTITIQMETVMDSNNVMEKRWLSPSDLEEDFGIKISTQNNLRRAKTIPYSKFGKHVTYDRIKINKMLEDSEVCDGTGV